MYFLPCCMKHTHARTYTPQPGHAGTVWSAAFDASGSVLVTCSDDGSIRVWQWHVHSNNGGCGCVYGV